MSDPFATQPNNLFTASTAPYAVVPDDVNPLPTIPKFLYVGSAGDITLCGIDETVDVVMKNVPIGTLYVRPGFVRATGTTASNIVAMV